MRPLERELRNLVAQQAAKAVKELMDKSVHPVVDGAPRDIAVGTTVVGVSPRGMSVKFSLAAQDKKVSRVVNFDLDRKQTDDDNWLVQLWKELANLLPELIKEFPTTVKPEFKTA